MAAAENRERMGWREAHEHPEAEELEFRVHHLHVAAEHLDEAGFHEAADKVRGEAEEMERQFHERRGRGHDDELGAHVRELTGAFHGLKVDPEAGSAQAAGDKTGHVVADDHFVGALGFGQVPAAAVHHVAYPIERGNAVQ